MTWLRVSDSEDIRYLTLDRPDRRNAVPHDGWADLRDAFHDFEAADARVLVISGEDGNFCSGADLDANRVEDIMSIRARHERLKLVGAAATALHRLTKPTIAAVDGAAVGAGMNLALGCDVVIGTTRARFAELFVRRGLTVDFAGTWLLPRIVGLQRAKELALSGRTVGAEEALRIGLMLEMVEPEALIGRATEIALSFIEGAPIAQMFAKQGIDASFESSFSESVGWEGQSQSLALGTEDAVEGILAFIEKRSPTWKGR